MPNTYGLKDMLTHWQRAELCWLVLATLSVLSISLLLGDSTLGICSSLSGIICVVMTAKGKLAAYYFGIVNCVLYAIVAYGQTLYGETLLNLCYYLPLQFIGFRIWRRNMATDQAVVRPVHMSKMQRLLLPVTILAGTGILGWLLERGGDEIPYVDAFTTVTSVLAMTLSARRCSEQWYLWISINLFSIYMWTERYLTNGENIATLLMWVVFLLNSIYGLYKWTRR